MVQNKAVNEQYCLNQISWFDRISQAYAMQFLCFSIIYNRAVWNALLLRLVCKSVEHVIRPVCSVTSCSAYHSVSKRGVWSGSSGNSACHLIALCFPYLTYRHEQLRCCIKTLHQRNDVIWNIRRTERSVSDVRMLQSRRVTLLYTT